MISPKRNKSLKFNRVEKHKFKFAKRLSINKSNNDSNNNFIYDHTPNNKKEKRRRSQISSALKASKNIDENYSPTKNKEPLKTMKKLHSTNKIQMIRFKDLILKQKNYLKKEEQKNETNNYLPIVLKLNQNNAGEKKKFISSNNIAHILNYTKDLFKNDFRKTKIKNNNDFENENTNYDINNVVKIKKKKKESKEISNNEIFEYKHKKHKKEHKDKKEHKNKKENHENKSKNEVKEDKKNEINEENDENKKDNSLKNNVKCKFFCCL